MHARFRNIIEEGMLSGCIMNFRTSIFGPKIGHI
jgi:hypothetical protein